MFWRKYIIEILAVSGMLCAPADAVPIRVDFAGEITEIREDAGNIIGSAYTLSGYFLFDSVRGAPPDSEEPDLNPSYVSGRYEFRTSCCSNQEQDWLTAFVTVNGVTYEIDSNGGLPSAGTSGHVLNSNQELVAVVDRMNNDFRGDGFTLIVNELDRTTGATRSGSTFMATDQAYLQIDVSSDLVDFIFGDGLLQEFRLGSSEIRFGVGSFRWRDDVIVDLNTGPETAIADALASFSLTSVSWRSVPEPTSVALLGLGLAGMGALRRRTTKKPLRKAA